MSIMLEVDYVLYKSTFYITLLYFCSIVYDHGLIEHLFTVMYVGNYCILHNVNCEIVSVSGSLYFVCD